jgi:ribosomal protein S12 methylthiotransferase
MPEKVALINLGCPKNLVDSEVMLGHLKSRGYELTAIADDADVIVVNTCGFLQDAAQESVNTLLEAAERKRNGTLKAVVAAGCMTQRFGADVAEAMPEVDGFLGVGQGHALPDVVAAALLGDRPQVLQGPSAGFEGYGLRLQATPSHTAYLKISEGCDRKCAFCIIPQIRGGMVSRTIDAIVREAEVLAAQGTREVILIGQDPTRYGVDLARSAAEDAGLAAAGLPELLRRLNDIPDLRWIRLMYLFPDRNAPAVMDAIAELPKVVKYVDIPFQHAAPEVLRRMNRPGSGAEYLALLDRMRRRCPEVSIRSTFIAGFPGETEAHFQEVLDFSRAAQMDWVGVFRYSPEEGTPAAEMEQIPEAVIRERHDRLIAQQQGISRERLARWIGREVEVVLEVRDGDRGAGRFAGQAPEVDGETLLDLSGHPDLHPGDFVHARVTGSSVYDLEAQALALLHRPPRRGQDLLHIGVLS